MFYTPKFLYSWLCSDVMKHLGEQNFDTVSESYWRTIFLTTTNWIIFTFSFFFYPLGIRTESQLLACFKWFKCQYQYHMEGFFWHDRTYVVCRSLTNSLHSFLSPNWRVGHVTSVLRVRSVHSRVPSARSASTALRSARVVTEACATTSAVSASAPPDTSERGTVRPDHVRLYVTELSAESGNLTGVI